MVLLYKVYMPITKAQGVQDSKIEDLGILHWTEAERRKLKSGNFWNQPLKAAMWEQGGWTTREYVNKLRGCKFSIVYDRDYVAAYLNEKIFKPLGTITAKGEFIEDLVNEILNAAVEYSISKENEHPKFVRERDIDQILLEEFHCSESFRKMFLANTAPSEFCSGDFRDAKNSVRHHTGESDMEVYFSGYDNKGWCFLIENKIYSDFQPNQAERYTERGKAYVENGKCSGFTTVLIVPEQYLKLKNCTKSFDRNLTYEQLHRWFLEQSDLGDRAIYKASFFEAAIKQYPRKYQKR